MSTAADDYPLVDLMWTFVLFFALLAYFWLLLAVFGDLFRRQDVSGWAKAGWVVFVLVLPMIGSFAYLVSQGRDMADRNARRVHPAGLRTDARSGAAPSSHGVDEIVRAKELLDQGAITQEEFQLLKRRALV